MIDLFQFGRFYKTQWKTVTSIFLVCGVVALAYVLITTPLYRAQVILQFHSVTPQGDSVGGTLGVGLALAGLQNDRASPERAESFGVLKSRAFLLPFIERMKLAPALFPSRFDQSTGALLPGKTSPSTEDLHRVFTTRVMNVDDNFTTGLVTVSVFLPKAEQAEEVANKLVIDLNEKLRASTAARSNESIRYLEQQLRADQVAEIRVAIAQLIQSEMRRVLVAGGESAHVFLVIDPALRPDKPYAPRKLLVLGLTLLVAVMLSVFAVLIRYLGQTLPR